jgi:cobaltochelatase CobN
MPERNKCRNCSSVWTVTCEIKEAQIRDGLHILGRLPDGEQLIDLLLSLVRTDNGIVPGLIRALAEDLHVDYASLHQELSAAAPTSIFTLRGTVFDCSFPPPTCRTCGDIIEALNGLALCFIEECLRAASFETVLDAACPNHELPLENTRRTLEFLWRTVWPRLQLCHQEIDHILRALAGRFVPPGPSGAPTRGSADILPTGRNFYSCDIRAIPTHTAWRTGCAAAEALLQRHRERTGAYPESIALVVWGTSNMRTGGDDIAEILYLLGVRPRWDDANRRVTGLVPIPLTELGRPRIDVTVRISGLFRDAFPNLVRLLNEAVALVARLEEPLDWNHVRAHIARDTALLSSAHPARNTESKGSEGPDSHPSSLIPRPSSLPVEEAARRAELRVFGSKPGAYGAGLLPLADGRNWQRAEDLARVYLAWSSYAYTGSAEEDGREETEAIQLRLSQTEVVVQNQDNREHDIFDSDDYFQFHGGMIATIRTLRGAVPEAYLGDSSRPENIRIRTLREEACRVFRSRVINPRWLTGVMRHGYKGGAEMAATVDYLFGYDATAEILDDWMYERLAATYLLDDSVRDFLRRSNPWAERAMVERLLEAAERGLWENPDASSLARLHAIYHANDAWLEGQS